MTSPPVPTQNETPKMNLLHLPEELQIMIFDFAYAQDGPLDIITLHEWNKNEMRKRIVYSTYQPQPFAGCKVAEFLVSKQYFQSAARAWVGTRPISSFIIRSATRPRCGTWSDVLCKYAQHVNFEEYYSSFNQVDDFPSMTIATFILRPPHFLDLAPKCPLLDLILPEEIESADAFRAMCRLRGVKKLEIDGQIGIGPLTKDPVTAGTWCANVVKFRELLLPHVTQPKPKRLVLNRPKWDQLRENLKRSQEQRQKRNDTHQEKVRNDTQRQEQKKTTTETALESHPRETIHNIEFGRSSNDKRSVLSTSLSRALGEPRPGYEIPWTASELRAKLEEDEEGLMSVLRTATTQLRKLYALIDQAGSAGR